MANHVLVEILVLLYAHVCVSLKDPINWRSVKNVRCQSRCGASRPGDLMWPPLPSGTPLTPLKLSSRREPQNYPGVDLNELSREQFFTLNTTMQYFQAVDLSFPGLRLVIFFLFFDSSFF